MTEAKTAATEARARRDMAVIVAHLDQGVAPVTLYRDTLKCSRTMFNKIIMRAPENRPEIPDALEVARQATKDAARYDEIEDKAHRLRDETAGMLMNGLTVDGKRVPPVPNAEIARRTGLTTARVAQLRTGTR